jgi:hypothetical protein
MPFLHWEVEKRLYRMAQFAEIAKRRKDFQERIRRANTLRYKARLADVARLQQSKPQRPQTWYDNEGRRSKYSMYWRPRHPLAKYFWHAAKLFQIIDEAADGRLVEDHLFEESPLHMRRTLEQFYYWTAPDTTGRDKEQVVCRGTRTQNEDPDATARLVMVDQLWLWILDESESSQSTHAGLQTLTLSRYRDILLPSTMGPKQSRPVGCSSRHQGPVQSFGRR